MIINGNNAEPFPLEKFNKNWPFCEGLAKFLFQQSPDFASLKKLFYSLAPYDSENESANESDNETDYVYDLSYSSFFIENDTLYYAENYDGTVYTLDHIPYNTLACEAVRHYVKDSIKTNRNQSIVWRRVFTYLLDQRFSVLDVLIEENFIEKMKPTIIQNFYYGFRSKEKDRLSKASLEKITKRLPCEIGFSKERLLGILLYCEFPRTDSEILITDFFRKKSYQNILLYYQNVLSDRFQITEDYYK